MPQKRNANFLYYGPFNYGLLLVPGLSGDGKKSIKELLEAIYPRSGIEDYILNLEPIAGNQNAVYQYLSKEDNLPPLSRSPNHTTTDSQETYTEEVQLEEEENNFIDEKVESENIEKGEEDAEKGRQDSEEPEEPKEEACDKDLTPCKCLICNRTYRVRGHLRRHLWTVHKIVSSDSTTNSSDSMSSSKKMSNGKVPDNPNTSPSSSSDSQSQKSPKEDKVSSKAQFSIGFDIKARFCKLCRRTFSSMQNLEKHIELHTDNGTDFFVKFYSCPLCRYKTRRKRDVLRHLSEVHKKKSSYLSRISQSLESYTIKKPAEVVLNKEEEKDQGQQEEVNVHHYHTSPYLTRRNLLPKAPGIVGKKTLKTNKKKRHNEEVTHNKKIKPSSPKGSATKKSLHVCNICGQSFKKTRYLGLHKRSHLKTATRSAGIRTRSKVMLWWVPLNQCATQTLFQTLVSYLAVYFLHRYSISL